MNFKITLLEVFVLPLMGTYQVAFFQIGERSLLGFLKNDFDLTFQVGFLNLNVSKSQPKSYS